ncbi:4-phosphoerythronate dehydrogenase [Thalassotalea euphylliae]|uniref:4-phosphoerythronate dehydrogenase n=1 Tax=Thalassotalea euphylliae TaxID=1655234 RepID=UPI00363694CA
MNIYFDENMPFAREFFQELNGKANTLIPFNGRQLEANELIDADVLLVRSITKVTKALLNNSPNVRFVGTATIGVDHINRADLSDLGVYFTSAPGCNAISVAEYVISSLVVLAERYQFAIKEKSVGIIGAGNTGSRLSEKLTALGIEHVLCDPILEKGDDTRAFVDVETALACDVISLHVPLTIDGECPTYHLLSEQRIKALREDQIVINACRGEVADNHAFLARKKSGSALKLVLDVWENEPNVLQELIPFTEIASAHIAGYSLEGKARGTEMLYLALCHQLGISAEKQLSDFLPKPAISEVKINNEIDDILLNQLVKMVYDVRRDDAIFRQQLNQIGFDQIRKTYPARREFSSLSIAGESPMLGTLSRLGFK